MVCPTGQSLMPESNLHTGEDTQYGCADLSKLYQNGNAGFSNPNVATNAPVAQPLWNSTMWFAIGITLGLIVWLRER